MRRSNIRLGLTGALLLILAGIFAGCAESPVGVDGQADPTCVWIDGVIHCER